MTSNQLELPRPAHKERQLATTVLREQCWPMVDSKLGTHVRKVHDLACPYENPVHVHCRRRRAVENTQDAHSLGCHPLREVRCYATILRVSSVLYSYPLLVRVINQSITGLATGLATAPSRLQYNASYMGADCNRRTRICLMVACPSHCRRFFRQFLLVCPVSFITQILAMATHSSHHISICCRWHV